MSYLVAGTMETKSVDKLHQDDCVGSILISDLKPYTSYLVAISIITSNDQTINFDIPIKTLGPMLIWKYYKSYEVQLCYYNNCFHYYTYCLSESYYFYYITIIIYILL